LLLRSSVFSHTLLLFFPLSFFSQAIAAPEPLSLSVARHFSQSLRIPRLARAAVADVKVAKVRALPPHTLLITGVSVGRTVVRAWDDAGRETAYIVNVSSAETAGEPDPVVKISLEFLEFNTSLKEGLGVRWPEALHFVGSAALTGNLDSSGMNYSAGFTTAQGWIQHLVRKGWAKLLARPDLFVRLGEQATFQSGGEFPVSTSQENYGRTVRRVEWKPYGLNVRVKPHSADGVHLATDIRVEISELNPGGGMDGVPGLTRRMVETKMNSIDGETVVLSGLVRQATGEAKEGLPFLSDIPLIGAWLFGSTSSTREETEIFMGITLSFATRRTHEAVHTQYHARPAAETE